MQRDRDCRASRRRYWLDTPVWAPQQASRRLRRHRTSGRLRVVMGVLASGSGRRSGAARSSVGIDRSQWLERIENQSAAFATIDFLIVVILCDELQRVRKHSQAAAFALIVFHLRESRTVVALGDSVVENAEVVGNRCGGFLALGQRRFEFFFLGGVLGLNVVANG